MAITPRKFASLSPAARLRKAARVFTAAEAELISGGRPDGAYLVEILSIVVADEVAVSDSGRRELGRLAWSARRQGGEPGIDGSYRRWINACRHLLRAESGEETADWDLFPRSELPGVRTAPGAMRAVYLEDLRSPFNVGSILRTAEAFGMSRVVLSPMTPGPAHPRVARSARGAESRLEVVTEGLSPGDPPGPAPLFALETGGTALDDFEFPPEGIMVVGSEELGVSPELLDRCRREAGVLSIDTPGPKLSMNVGVAAGIALHAWWTRVRGS